MYSISPFLVEPERLPFLLSVSKKLLRLYFLTINESLVTFMGEKHSIRKISIKELSEGKTWDLGVGVWEAGVRKRWRSLCLPRGYPSLAVL